MVFDPFSSLAVSARSGPAGSGGPGRNRMRVGVGAAIVLLLAALGVTVMVTAIGQVGHSVEVAANAKPPDETAGASDGEGALGQVGEAPGAGVASSEPVIFVHVLGAVARPGLFEVLEGARVVDVVAAAGGLLPEADQAGVNLARSVTDGEQLYVPAQGEVAPGGSAAPAAGAAGGAGEIGGGAGVAGTVNLNTATLADLDTLPRIGPMMAQRILDYRDAEGRFTSVDDLQNVTGIGEKTFAALKDLVSV